MSARSPDFRQARAVAEAVQAAVQGATSLSCSLGVGTCKVVAKVASDRRKPGGITVVPPGPGGGVPRAVRRAAAPGRRAAGRGAPAGAGVETIGELARARGRPTSRGSFRARSGGSCATARGASTRGRSRARERGVSIGHEETFPRDVSDREQLHDELRRMAEPSPSTSSADGQVARTVTTKLRYPDFSIRSRSTTSAPARGRGERIGELACALLDRALADRPGRPAPRRRQRLEPRGAPAAACSTDRRRDVASATAAAGVASRCWCEGQYSRSGSGVRWHGLPLRVVARQRATPPSKAPASICSSMNSTAAPMPSRHRPGDLRLVRDREVAADVLEEGVVGMREVARILGEALDALLARGEHVTAVLELLLGVHIRVDEVLDRAINGSRVLIHTRRGVVLFLDDRAYLQAFQKACKFPLTAG